MDNALIELTQGELNGIRAFLVISFLLFCLSALAFIIQGFARRPGFRKAHRKISGLLSSGFLSLAFLMISIWSARFAVGYFRIVADYPEFVGMNLFEESINSIVHALQTFSMDEDYTAYIIDGKIMIAEIFGDSSAWQTIYGVYASILNMAAPIVGGAIIFDIIASFVPKVWLMLYAPQFWREKYYFSKLNEASLSLYRDIKNTKYRVLCAPVVVFCDVYTDEGSENHSEMLAEAKSLGAICLRDDISRLSKSHIGIRKYLLIDENEILNLRAFSDLASEDNYKCLRNGPGAKEEHNRLEIVNLSKKIRESVKKLKELSAAPEGETDEERKCREKSIKAEKQRIRRIYRKMLTPIKRKLKYAIVHLEEELYETLVKGTELLAKEVMLQGEHIQDERARAIAMGDDPDAVEKRMTGHNRTMLFSALDYHNSSIGYARKVLEVAKLRLKFFRLQIKFIKTGKRNTAKHKKLSEELRITILGGSLRHESPGRNKFLKMRRESKRAYRALCLEANRNQLKGKLNKSGSSATIRCFAKKYKIAIRPRPKAETKAQTEIYLFSQSDIHNEVEHEVRETLLKHDFTESQLPVIVPVKRHRNLVSNMLADYPLYEPLISKRPSSDGKLDLNLTVLGTGSIGMEMILSSYWFCQMLNVRTTINVVSEESSESFFSKLDNINPELRHTMIPEDPILIYDRDGNYQEPYCTIKYAECDVKSSKFLNLFDEYDIADDESGAGDMPRLSRSDYVFIALGSDEENLNAAHDMLRHIGRSHIREKGQKTIINYVLYDPELASTLNGTTRYQSADKRVTDIYMRAVGNLDEIYSVKNVFMQEHSEEAAGIHSSYLSMQDKGKILQGRRRRGTTSDQDYTYWADLARTLHKKYKAFSAGIRPRSIFEVADDEEYRREQKMMIEEYRDFVNTNIDAVSPEAWQSHLEKLHLLSWVEHRRWCAFGRIKGFMHPSDYTRYKAKTGSHKHMELKLHACLIECGQFGTKRAEICGGKEIIFRYGSDEWLEHGENHDLLDNLAYVLRGQNPDPDRRVDFKQFDYPFQDFV